MRKYLQALLLTALILIPAACSRPKIYTGPEVTRVVIFKSERTMYLLHGNQALKKYRIDLGFQPVGEKKVRADGKTPEGRYFIDRRNPDSAFHLSLGISYPNARDIAQARSVGKSPGGDIFIHGGPKLFRDRFRPDWTAGCISVSNREMDQIYAMVKVGTPIDIHP
ncbi:MAG: murein L,D-transpeptidase family protein [Paracoccaceae bacterium]